MKTEAQVSQRPTLDEAVLRGVYPLINGMTVVYLVLTAGHLLVLAPPIRTPMVSTAALSVLFLILLRLVLLRYPPRPRLGHPLVALLSAVVLFNSLLHLYLSGEPHQTTNLMLMLIGSSFFFLSWLWFLPFLGLTLAGWVGVLQVSEPSPLWLHFGFALFMTVVMALCISVVYTRNLLRQETLRLRLEQRNRALEMEIEERQRAEAESRRHQAEMTHMARLSLAGEMASGLAHELNQPLTAVAVSSDACLNLMRSHRAGIDDLYPVLEQISRQSHRAGEIIHRMKNFTRKVEPRRMSTNINTVIREVVKFLAHELARQRVQLRLDLADALPPVGADAIQIQQVLVNLLRNAVEALQDPRLTEHRIALRSRPLDASCVRVSVFDTGPGLSELDIDRVFEPFYTTKSNGMGLGLSISQSIIKAHGGRLWASPGEHGMAFHFTLPVVESGADDHTGG